VPSVVVKGVIRKSFDAENPDSIIGILHQLEEHFYLGNMQILEMQARVLTEAAVTAGAAELIRQVETFKAAPTECGLGVMWSVLDETTQHLRRMKLMPDEDTSGSRQDSGGAGRRPIGSRASVTREASRGNGRQSSREGSGRSSRAARAGGGSGNRRGAGAGGSQPGSQVNSGVAERTTIISSGGSTKSKRGKGESSICSLKSSGKSSLDRSNPTSPQVESESTAARLCAHRRQHDPLCQQ